MQPIIHVLILSFFFLFLNTLPCQNRCAAVEARQAILEASPDWKNQKAKTKTPITSRSVITIPIVVHVVYNSSDENIPDEQIHSQIDILNQDYRALNAEIPSIPSEFQPLIADTEIEFCLAAVDPDGNQTIGITRTFTNNPVGIGGTSAIHYSAQGGQDAWDTDRYLNIWVAKFAGGIGGIASFPGIGPPEEDGVEINYLQFGNINVQPPYHLGRTLTHEIGHYLNLEHPWGPAITDCCESDFVDDTPESCETYIGQCPAHPSVSCSMPDMFMNYMFYSNDECLGMFTLGQKMRMLTTLNTVRSGLLDSEACDFVPTEEPADEMAVKILSNPASQKFRFEINKLHQTGFVKIFDVAGREVFSKKINKVGVQEVDIEGVKRGVHLFVFENGKSVTVEKVIFI